MWMVFKGEEVRGEKIELSSDNMWKETKLSLIEVYDSFVLLSSIEFTCKG